MKRKRRLALFQKRLISLLLNTIIVCGILFCTAGYTHAQTEDDCLEYRNSRTDKIYEKAIRSYRQRRYSESIQWLNDVIAIEPNYVDAYFVLGINLHQRKQDEPKSSQRKFYQGC